MWSIFLICLLPRIIGSPYNPDSSDTDFGITLKGIYKDVLHDGRGNEIWDYNLDIGIKLPVGLKDEVEIKICHSKTRLDLPLLSNDFIATYHSNYRKIRLSYRKVIVPFASFTGSLGGSEHLKNVDYSLNILLSLPSGYRLRGKIDKTAYPTTVELQYDSSLSLSQFLRCATYEIETSKSLFNETTIKWAGSHSVLDSTITRDCFTLSGTINRMLANVSYSGFWFPSLLMVFEKGNLFFSLRTEGIRFAKATTEFSTAFYSLNLKIMPDNRLTLYPEVCYYTFKIACNGSIAFWPFKPVLVDLLGERRYFIGEGKISEYGVTLLGEYQLNKNLTIKGALEYATLKGNGNIVSWKPLFMGGGVDDLRDDSPALQGAGLGGMTVKLIHRLDRFVIGCGFEQIIPIWTEYKEGTAPLPPGTKAQGGRMYTFSLKYLLQ